MNLQRKAVPVVGFKILDDEKGVVETIVSVTGIVDEVKDRIKPGAYAKTLAKRTPKGAWSHDWSQPVSKTLAAEELMPGDARLPKKQRNGEDWPAEAGGLLIRTQYNLKTQRGVEAYEDAKFFGDEQEWSIGYSVPVGGAVIDKKTGVRDVGEIELFEYSQVLFGAMPLAATVGIKAAQEAFREAKEAAGTTPHPFRGEGDVCEACGEPDGTKAHVAPPEEEPLLEGQEAAPSGEKAEPAGGVETKKAIAPHSTGTSDGMWDGPAQRSKVKAERAALRKAFAWVDPDGDQDTKTAYRFIHHFVGADGDPGDASTTACTTGIGVLNGGRGGTTIPDADRKGVWDHLARHLRDAGEEPPDLKDLDGAGEKAATLPEDLTQAAPRAFESDFVIPAGTAYADAVKILEAASKGEHKAFVQVNGSYEERQEALNRAVRGWVRDGANPLLDFSESRYRYYAYVEATFDDRVVFAVVDWREDSGSVPHRFFEAPYAMGTDGAELGDVREVVLETTVAAKSIQAGASNASAAMVLRAAAVGLEEKAGRVLSRRNRDAVRAALSALRDVLSAAGEEEDSGKGGKGDEGGDEDAGQEPEETQDKEPEEHKSGAEEKVLIPLDELELAKALAV